MVKMVTKGPIPANVYWANPPVKFGINAFNSAIDKAVRILMAQAKIIAMIKPVPKALVP